VRRKTKLNNQKKFKKNRKKEKKEKNLDQAMPARSIGHDQASEKKIGIYIE